MEHSPERQRSFSSSESDPLPLSHNAVQIRLATSAFPNAPKPILPWLEEDETGHSLAEKFRAYVESPSHQGETIVLTDEQRLEQLLAEVKNQTLH